MHLKIRYLKDRNNVQYSSFDGAYLFYKELINYLHQTADIDLIGHDATEVHSSVQSSETEDIFLSIGPYAYVHYYWREVENKDFRIVRDVSTWLWSGYWLQEELCVPLSRPKDIVIFPSHFIRDFYLSHFPELNRSQCVVFYCAVLDEQNKNVIECYSRKNILYLGALSMAKGVDVLIRCSNQIVAENKIEAFGVPNSTEFKDILAQSSSNRNFSWKGTLARKNLIHYLRKAKCLIFPTVASRETLGRVVLEASHCECPVIGTHFGPLPELIPPNNLIAVDFIPGRYNMSKVVPLAAIRENELIEQLNASSWESVQLPEYYNIQVFPSILANRPIPQSPNYNLKPGTINIVKILEGNSFSIFEAVRVFDCFFGNGKLGSTGISRIDESFVPFNKRSIHDYRLFPRFFDQLGYKREFIIQESS